MAAEEVQNYLQCKKDWESDLKQGKMFGVLIVQTSAGEVGYLAAFSGILAGKNLHEYFVPPIYDLQQPQGFFSIGEERISAINSRIEQLQSSPDHLAACQKLDEAVALAAKEINVAKEELKKAQQRREERRLNNPDEHELSAMIHESQFQKAELKRLKQQWNERIAAIRTETETFKSEIERLKTERKTRSAALQQQLLNSSKYSMPKER